jgi:hypothetical protein
MVRTGRRAATLLDALIAAGLQLGPPPERPRLSDLPGPIASEFLALYRQLGVCAPRWKQRAVYDALKDVVSLLPGGIRLARVATHDTVDGVTLGTILDGRGAVDPRSIRALVESRIAAGPLNN